MHLPKIHNPWLYLHAELQVSRCLIDFLLLAFSGLCQLIRCFEKLLSICVSVLTHTRTYTYTRAGLTLDFNHHGEFRYSITAWFVQAMCRRMKLQRIQAAFKFCNAFSLPDFHVVPEPLVGSHRGVFAALVLGEDSCPRRCACLGKPRRAAPPSPAPVGRRGGDRRGC